MSRFQRAVLNRFRGTGDYVGRDQFHKDRLPPKGVTLRTLLSLRRQGLLEHFCANRWYLTRVGQDVVYRRATT